MNHYHDLYVNISFINLGKFREYDINVKEFLEIGLENIQAYLESKKYNI